MYGKNARQTMFAVLKECPELRICRAPTARKDELKPLTDALLKQIADRVMLDLWHRGFSVSARQKGAARQAADKWLDDNPEAHQAWRATKLKPRKEPVQGLKDPFPG